MGYINITTYWYYNTIDGRIPIILAVTRRIGLAHKSTKPHHESGVSLDKESNINSDDSLGELSQVQPSGEILRHPRFFFDDTLVAIQVESTLFKVHKNQLAKSEVFSDMLKKHRAEGDGPEKGSSPEDPIPMKGIAASDFAALLEVLYTGFFSINEPILDAPHIIPAFRLANTLDFPELRKCLLPHAEKCLGDVDMILLAREFNIREWLAPAHISLCRREEPPSIEEAKQLEFA
ncbi:hypothetical protein RSAG8_10021, partial [Rhizoctonia solani AG-8 WAC10335]